MLRYFVILSLLVSATLAAVPNQAHLNFNVRTKNAVTSESIDVNYRENYVMIYTYDQAYVVMLHDYTQGLSLIKKNGVCFILDEFDQIPENIEDWAEIKASMDEAGEDEVDGDAMNVETFYYKALPFNLDRKTLPASIQGFCSDPVRVLVLEQLVEGEDAEDGSTVAKLFFPGKAVKSRVKRQSGRITVGGPGPYVEAGVEGRGGGVNGRYDFGSRTWSAGGSLSRTSGPWTTTGQASYHSRNGGSFGGSVNYNRGAVSGSFGVNHNTRNHGTNVQASLRIRF